MELKGAVTLLQDEAEAPSPVICVCSVHEVSIPLGPEVRWSLRKRCLLKLRMRRAESEGENE